MTNYREDLGLSVLGQKRIIPSRHEFCFPGVCMLGHALSTSDTAKFITNLPLLLVETSTGQRFCVVIFILRPFFYIWGFFLRENLHHLLIESLYVWVLIFLIAAPLSVFWVLLSALKQLDFQSWNFLHFQCWNCKIT